jgi:hypothetical protein
MILSPTDSPQIGTLPDLTPVLRCMILQTDLDHCGFILTPLYAALPCIRRPTARKALSESYPDTDTHQVAICILMALLLGLYPSSVKFPPFSVRVAIYRRIHCLLTHGQGTVFCESYPSLLTLALMEYASYVITTNLPVEYEILCEEHCMQTFFSTCPLTCDAFRQEVLETGEESWDSLEAYCSPIVERHSRACKSRHKTRQSDIFPVIKLNPSFADHLQDIPFIVPYSVHLEDSTNCIMASEMAFLGLSASASPSGLNQEIKPTSGLTSEGLSVKFNENKNQNALIDLAPQIDECQCAMDCSIGSFSSAAESGIAVIAPEVDTMKLKGFNSSHHTGGRKSTHATGPSGPGPKSARPLKSSKQSHGIQDNLINHEQAVVMQRTVHTHQLPPNLTKLQLSALSARMRVCERSALSGSVLYVCISCVLANQQTICRKGKAFPTRGQCKYDFDSQSLICSVCQSHSIISISTLGRIISLRNYRFYLAPCCSTVQVYTGRGDEFQDTPETCPHKQVKTSSKISKKRCELCSNVALQESLVSVDHLTGELHHTNLCQRHTPHSDALKHVTNWRQLQEEIRRRDRPLFANGNYGRGNKGK